MLKLWVFISSECRLLIMVTNVLTNLSNLKAVNNIHNMICKYWEICVGSHMYSHYESQNFIPITRYKMEVLTCH